MKFTLATKPVRNMTWKHAFMRHTRQKGVRYCREMEWDTYTVALSQGVLMVTMFLNHLDRIAGWAEGSHIQSTR